MAVVRCRNTRRSASGEVHCDEATGRQLRAQHRLTSERGSTIEAQPSITEEGDAIHHAVDPLSAEEPGGVLPVHQLGEAGEVGQVRLVQGPARSLRAGRGAGWTRRPRRREEVLQHALQPLRVPPVQGR